MNDPRGPIREIVSIEERSDATMITMSCGHTGRFNQIFHYKIGASVHCFQCGQLEKYSSWSGDPVLRPKDRT